MKRALALLLLTAAAAAPAQDRAAIDRTRIIGNSELPKVLYIVPWKKPLPGKLSGRPVNSVLDEALSPLERDVFRREIAYDAQLQARADGKPDAAAATPHLSSQPAPNGASR
jgi:hypothetical protein